MTVEKEPLLPVSEAEFATALAITIAALRARKKVRATYDDAYNAKNIAESLWLGGMRPFHIDHLSLHNARPSAHTMFGGSNADD
jgi:hypothetical protein